MSSFNALEGNIFAATEFLQFRNLYLPVADWEMSFSHASAQHHILFREGVAVDQLGGQGEVYTYRLIYSNGIAQSPFANAFTTLYHQFYAAFKDKSPGDLVDPIHGPKWVTPGSWQSMTDVSGMVDGVNVRVTFTVDRAVDADAMDQVPTYTGLVANAADLDQAASVVDWERPESIPNLTDPLSAVSGLVQQGNRVRDRVKAGFLSVANRAGELERATEDSGSEGGPGTNAVRMAARKLRLDATRAANSSPQELIQLVREITLESPKTAMEIAATAGMELSEFLKLNTGISRLGYIRAGTTVRVTKGRRRRR